MPVETFWNDPEIIARSDAARDHAVERAMRARTQDPIGQYSRTYDLTLRNLRAAERRESRRAWMTDIGIQDLLSRLWTATASGRSASCGYPPQPVAVAVSHRRGSGILRFAAAGVCTVLACVLLALSAIAGYALIRWDDIAGAVAIAEQQMACAAVTAMTDTNGRIVAYEPVVDAATCTRRRAELSLSFDDPGRLVARPGLTVPFGPEVVSALVPALVTIEGEIAPFPQTVFGHDWRGPLRYGAAAVGLLNGERGFSGPILSAFEALIGHPQSMPLRHKLITVIAASVFVHRHLPDEAARARFVVDFMPAVRGRGYPLGGRLATDALFGRDPATLAERCIVARAMGTPLVLPLDRGDVGSAAGEAWGSVLGPAARRCVTKLAGSRAEAHAALAELNRLCGDDDICARPSLGPDRDVRARRLAAIARAHLPIVPGRARESEASRRAMLDGLRLSGDWRPGETVATTIDRDALVALDETIPGLLADLERRLPDGLCFSGDCRNPAIYSVAAVEITVGGPVYRAGHTSHHGQFFGPVRRGADGYVAHAPDWGLGSVAKSVLALVAARHGYAALCSLADGDDACSGGTWVSVERAIAESANDEFAWLAKRHMNEIDVLRDAIGAAPAAHPATPREIVLDMVRHAPTAAYATLFSALLLNGPVDTVRIGSAGPRRLDLAALGYDEATRTRALKLLAAPVLAPGGTLRATARAAVLPGCTAIAGKSGTHAAGAVNIVKASILVWRCTADGAERTFITTVVINSGAPDVTLGARKHAELAPFHRAALSAVTGIATAH